MADTGAAYCMGDQKFLKSVGLSIKDLPRTKARLVGATGITIELIGVIPMIITTDQSNTRQLVYITKEESDFLLSYHALRDLGIVNEIIQEENKKRKKRHKKQRN